MSDEQISDLVARVQPGRVTNVEWLQSEVERLTADNDRQHRLLMDAQGATADWTDLPTDTPPAEVIRLLGVRVEEDPL